MHFLKYLQNTFQIALDLYSKLWLHISIKEKFFSGEFLNFSLQTSIEFRVSRGSGKIVSSPLIASFPLVCRPTICPENNEGNLLETKLLHFKLATEKKRSLISVQIALSKPTTLIPKFFFHHFARADLKVEPYKKGGE